MTSGTPTIFRFEDFLLDTAAAQLLRKGEPIALEPQVFDLLTLLVREHHRVVTRDEIIDAVWEGRIVSDGAISSRINAVRRALDDDGTRQRLIRTIHGRGFRFGTVPEGAASTSAAPARSTAEPAPRTSIAVLPLEAFSDNAELGYFADGIAEEILNALSRFHELAVIARNSSFTFRGKGASAREVAETLGVKFVLLGSVRQVGPRIRVAVQLVDATQDRAIWSDRYDGDLTDIFTVQDEIAAKAVAAIAPQAHYHEMATAYRKSPTDLNDWERVMRARWHMEKYARADTDTALEILGEVAARAPDLALAHSTMAICHCHRMLNAWCDDPLAEIAAAEAAGRRAVALDAYDAASLAVLGLAAMFGHRFEECFDRLNQAIAANPNLASAYGFLCTAHGCRGELSAALDTFDQAMRLSPADPTRTIWMSGKGIGLLLDGQYEASLENAERMLAIDPDYGPALRQKVGSLSHMGRLDEARAALADLLRRMPHLTITQLAKMVPVVGPENADHWLNGLRMAGLPE